MFKLGDKRPEDTEGPSHLLTVNKLIIEDTTIELVAYRNVLENFEYVVFFDGVVVAILRDRDMSEVVFNSYHKQWIPYEPLVCCVCRVPLLPETTFTHQGFLYCPEHLPHYDKHEQF